MKSVRIVSITLLLLVAVAVSVQAEDRQYLKANVPFGFTVGNVDLPAGTYEISLLSQNGAIKIRNAQTGKWAIATTRPGSKLQPPAHSTITFNRVAGHYFLSELSEQGNSAYRSLQSGKLEKELAKGEPKVKTTTILASAAAPKR